MGIKLTARHAGEEVDSPPFLEKAFKQNRITIGNHSTANLRLNGSVVAAEQVVIVDCLFEPTIINRAEGTALNGELLAADERRSLRDGDLLCIGAYRIDVSVYEEQGVSGATDEFASGNGHQPRASGAAAAQPYDAAENLPPASQSQLTTARLAPDLIDPFLAEFDERVAPSKSFAAILDGLRTDEDRFYFLIEGGLQSGMRVSIESEEMPLGWHVSGEALTFDVSIISSLLAIVRKDWSGVMLQPQAVGVKVNGEMVEGGRRLRDGDRVSFSPKQGRAESANEPILVFHEPASLVILDSLMPRSLPNETDPSNLAESNSRVRTAGKMHNSARKVAALLTNDKEYFGAFTLVELSLMAIGTVVGAIIIFLILNYS